MMDEVDNYTNELVQPRQNRPSDDNQRHSNKVESIEVVINSFERAREEYVPQMQPQAQPSATIEAVQHQTNQAETALDTALLRQKSDEQMTDEGGAAAVSVDFREQQFAALNRADAPALQYQRNQANQNVEQPNSGGSTPPPNFENDYQ